MFDMYLDGSRIKIPSGATGTLEDFRRVYSDAFLKKRGLNWSKATIYFPGCTSERIPVIKILGLTVLANANTCLTYVGKNKWNVGVKHEISKEKKA